MTKEDLINCRKAAEKLHRLQHELVVMRKSAGSLRSVTYSDMPRTRGEPLSPEQAHVERCEGKETEIRAAESDWRCRKDLIVKKMRERGLTRLQKELIAGYYIYGLRDWDDVNKKCDVNKGQSEYQVRLAFEKLFKNA